MKGMGFYLLVLGLIIAAMLISDNLYNSHQEVYNEVMFQEDLQSGKITGVEIYQNVEAPTGEIQIAVKTGEGEEIKSFYINNVENIVRILDEAGFTNFYIHDVTKPGWFVSILPYLLGFILVFVLLC